MLDIEREQRFYRKLLLLNEVGEIEPVLVDALDLIIETTNARRGYIELQADAGPSFRVAHGDTTKIGAAMDHSCHDRVIRLDFGEAPSAGIIHLENGTDEQCFIGSDRHHVETVAHHLAAITQRLLLQRRGDETDPTLPFRRSLRAGAIIGRSPALARVLQQASAAAPLDVTVLLTGPSGTGKTQLARVIHDSSPRADGPFVELNCAALPETLLESELFGAMPGAHSTARRKMSGKVAAADKGTLLLDELGELSFSAQAKLLQLLQSRQYYPLGATRPVHADLRVIAATSVDLKAAVQRKEFRADLFYRLSILPIRLPSLLERGEDIGMLARYFCRAACKTHRLPGIHLSPDALRAAEAFPWNGNVRELAHAMEAAVIHAASEGSVHVDRRNLFHSDRIISGSEYAPGAPTVDCARNTGLTLQEATRRFRMEFVRCALVQSGWNISEAAARLDIARSHLYKLIDEFGFERTQEMGKKIQ